MGRQDAQSRSRSRDGVAILASARTRRRAARHLAHRDRDGVPCPAPRRRARRASRSTRASTRSCFSDLPAEAVPGSIRVDGKATAGLDIQSVDTRRRYIPRADQEALQAERKTIEDEIEKLRDERGLLQGQEDAAQTQKTLLQNLGADAGRPQPEEGQPVPRRSPCRRPTGRRSCRSSPPGMADSAASRARCGGEEARARPAHRGAGEEARRAGARRAPSRRRSRCSSSPARRSRPI